MTREEAILILSHHPKLGAQSIKRILAAGISKNARAGWQSGNLNGKTAELASEAFAKYKYQDIIENLKRLDIGFVTLDHEHYPRLLSEIPDAPVILFVKGNASILDSAGISVVGSRKYSTYGARVAKKFSYELAASGLIIVSGLALGIDAIAHHAALDADGLTVGVLACGLDRIYPVANQNLADTIIRRGGAIISEYPPGSEPFRGNFPARNRIIAGLTTGTLVVEAAKDSGALITSTAALEYNREVYAIPGPIDSESSEGCNFLIQQGAKLTTSVDEIRQDYNIETKQAEQRAREYLPANETEKKIVAYVGSGSYSADEIVRESGYDVAEVSYTLTMLEMKGILENVNGMWRKKL